jgi:hypothetical protein
MAPEPVTHEDHFLKNFSDPEAVARYAEGPRRFVPGLEALHLMTGLLLAERTPTDARVLVLGAGGGSELKAMAEAHPRWRFVGVDPAAEMLRLAERTLGTLMDRVELIKGYIDDAPAGPFDAATCLLTLHFLLRLNGSEPCAEFTIDCAPELLLSPPMPAFRRTRACANCGLIAMPHIPLPWARIPGRSAKRVRRWPPACAVSAPSRTRPFCVPAALPTRRCSMWPSPGVVGLRTREESQCP